MAITLTQTDTADNAAGGTATCIPSTLGGVGRVATQGGTAGTVEKLLNVTANATSDGTAAFQSASGEPNSANWEGGSATFRWEITTANMFLTWVDISWAYKPSGGQGVSINCFTGLGISLSSPGVQSSTQTVSSSSGRDIADRIIISYGVANSSNMLQTIGWKPSQNIDTPVNQGVTFLAARPFVIRQAINRAATR